MNAMRGRAGRLAMVGAMFGLVAALAAPHLGGVTAGPGDTVPVETTVPDTPETTEAEPDVPVTTVEATAATLETTAPDTTEAVVVESTVPESTVPEPTGPLPTVAPSPKPDSVATDTTEPDGTVGPQGPTDTYDVTVVAACVDGTTPVVDFTNASTAAILVTVGGEPNWSTELAPRATARGTWPSTERGPETQAKWDARSVDPDGWADNGIVDMPADCPPPPNTPSAPENFSTMPGDGSVSLAWLPPSWDGGSPITDYVIQFNPYPVEEDGWTTVVDGGATSDLNVDGLDNCVTYLFRVRAINANGDGEWIDGKDTPADTPCAPPAPSATNVNGNIALEWSEPPSGSSPVTDYVIEYDAHPVDGAWTPVADGVNADTSFIVGGLTLGTRYSFRVTAWNAAGQGTPSETVEAVPLRAPSVARSLTATPTNVSGQVRLTWAAPLSNGGLPIEDYVILRFQTGGSWVTINDGINTNTSFVATGLTNGVRYYFIVRARSDVGDSVNSNTANAIPRTVPTGPRLLSVNPTSAGGQLRVSWQTPASNGGAAITDYIIQRSPDGVSNWYTIPDGTSTATAYTVTGFTNGRRYYFRVYAKNIAGQGASSTIASGVPGFPSAPRSLTAVPTNLSGQVRLSWTSPVANGGSTITDYVIQRSPNGSTWTTISDGVNRNTTITVTGLSNGVRYYFRVFARNARGQSPSSNIANAIPRTRPTAVRSLAAAPNNLSGQIRLSWLAPSSAGGSAVVDYLIQRSPTGTSSWTTITDGVNVNTAYTVTGLTNGVRYYFRVFARNAAGYSPVSTVASAIPRTAPSAPRNLLVTAGPDGFDLFWTAPASTGGSPITGYVIDAYDFDENEWFRIGVAPPTWRGAFVDWPGEGCATFRIAASNAAGVGPFHAPVEACWP